MKILREDGTIEFEGTAGECGAFCRGKEVAKEEAKNKKVKEVKEFEEKSKFEGLFSNPIFID